MKRRHWRWVVGAAAVVVIGTAWLGGGPTSMTSASYRLRPFVCGEELALGPGAADTQAGLTMTLSTVDKVDDTIGPTLEVTFTAGRALRVQGSPPSLYEVLYLRDGVIVGGGLLLNQPDDLTSQGMHLIGSGFDVGPGHPVTEDLGRRDTLCPGHTWPQVWSAPHRYEVVVIQGPVLPRPDVGPDQLLLDIPTLGRWPLIVARANLGTYGPHRSG